MTVVKLVVLHVHGRFTTCAVSKLFIWPFQNLLGFKTAWPFQNLTNQNYLSFDVHINWNNIN